MLNKKYIFLIFILLFASCRKSIPIEKNLKANEYYELGQKTKYKNDLKALAYFKKALSIKKDYADAVLAAGEIALTLDKLSLAKTYLKSALKLYRQNETKSLGEARTLTAQMMLALKEKKDSEAGDIYIKANDMYVLLGEEKSIDFARLLTYNGTRLWFSTTPRQATYYFEIAKKTFAEIAATNTVDYAVLMATCGSFYGEFNKLDLEITHYQKALQCYRALRLTNNKDYATLLLNLGVSSYFRKDYSGALSYYKNSQKILDTLGLTRDLNYAKLMENFGFAYYNTQSYPEAIESYILAGAIYRKIDFTESYPYGRLHFNLGNLYNLQKDSKKALKAYKTALKTFRLVGKVERARQVESEIKKLE